MKALAIIIIFLTFLIIGGAIGYLVYADIQKKWPFKEYERKTFPKGAYPFGNKITNENKKIYEGLLKDD
jgi:Trk-type K+ transport system membrane component